MEKANQHLDQLGSKINQETAKLPWVDLLRFFAQGRVVFVAQELDLVEIAAMVARDLVGEIESLMTKGSIARVSDEQAQRWIATDAMLWTVVVKPWVFVQEQKPATERQLH